MTDTPDFTKITGFEHFMAAARYSAGGAARLWKEAAFRQEVLGFAVLMAAHLAIGSGPAIFCAAVVLFLVLMAVEALNTAVEEIIDRISPEYSLTGKHAKDLGSFAVFCLLCANGVLLAYALFLWHAALWR